jgi:predicted phage baseplate assembly protein
MPIVPPLLDDRTWTEIRDEALARVPIYTPEWTDTHDGDPGVTLVDLFAFMTESLIYRLNRVPDNSYLAFLNLLNAPPLPAQPASGLLQLAVKGPNVVTVSKTSRFAAGATKFSTQDSMDVLPIQVMAFIKCRVDPPAPKTDQSAFADAAFLAYSTANAQPTSAFNPVHFTTQAYPAPDGSVIPLTRTVDGTLWIALVARASDDMDAVRTALGEQYLSIGVAPSPDFGASQTESLTPDDPGGNVAATSNQTQTWRWEISAPRGVTGYPTALGWNETPSYSQLQAVDTSAGMTRAGVIKIELPASPLLQTWTSVQPPPTAAGPQPPVPLASYPIAGDLPPLLDDGDVEQRVIAWLRAVPLSSSPSDPAPTRARIAVALSWVGENAVAVLQAVAQNNEALGNGDASPGQTFQVSFTPVVAASLTLTVTESGAPVTWTEVDNFDASTERDSAFMLDRALGTVTVGDGIRGRVVPEGAPVTASYQYGGGLAGNLPPGSITKMVDQPPPALDTGSIANPAATSGGSETETVDQARRRVPSILRHQYRAVTADDFRELTLLTPGASVGRAEVLPLYRPCMPATSQYPGVVTVLVVPSEDAIHPRAPQPDAVFRQAVCAYLDAHRLITTELYVIGPNYVQISVSVGIQPKSGYGIEDLTNWVCLALHQFLAPLPPFGPDGSGWPLGGRINRAALEAAVLQVDGVAWVQDLQLYQVMPDGTLQNISDVLTLGTIDLPELVQVNVGLQTAPPATAPGLPGNQIPVPVPTLRSAC